MSNRKYPDEFKDR